MSPANCKHLHTKNKIHMIFVRLNLFVRSIIINFDVFLKNRPIRAFYPKYFCVRPSKS